MNTTMNPTALFQHYVQKMFKFPKEIKHDIVYCQRALKSHIKVHQMVLDVYKTQANVDPAEKQRITDELETQIYEINAEQQFLLLRLRRMISDFHKFLERRGILVVPSITNEFISSELVPLINDQNFLIYPISVRLRCTEEKLIEKYFEAKNQMVTNYYEILDSDEEELHDNALIDQAMVNYKPIYNDSALNNLKVTKDKRNSRTVGESSAVQFVELCNDTVKESSKGISSIAPNITVSKIRNINVASNSVSTTSKNNESVYPVSIQASKSIIERENDDSSVSQNVKKSRLNLREVLKNAQSGHLAAKVATPPLSTQLSESASATKTVLVPTKKVEQNICNVSQAVGSTTSPTSSSKDSTPERCLVQQQTKTENEDKLLKPEDCGQEMFLRIFGLFTPEMRLKMQQRRSKRKRRTVQSNERSDYHYGHIDCTPVEDKKKRKAFLLSPQIKRAQGRPPKRRSVDKSDETTSRSNSSSPDDKRNCNECLKDGGTLEQCDACKQYYHQSCHSSKSFNEKSNKIKSCPSCRRMLKNGSRNEAQQYKTLQSNADKLKQKMALEKTRRKNLQKKSEKFKTQMNVLFNIIGAIKRNSANDCE